MSGIDEQTRPSNVGRPRQMSEGDRRRMLVDASADLFLNKGYHATTMDDVARCAGMSKKTLYQIFASKSELFDALLSAWFSPCFVSMEEDGRPPLEVLDHILTGLVNFVVSERQIAVLRLLISESAHSEDIAEALERQGLGRGKGVIEQWLRAQITRGMLKIDNVVEVASTLFFAAAGEFIMGLLLRTRVNPDDEEIKRSVGRAIAGFVRLYGSA